MLVKEASNTLENEWKIVLKNFFKTVIIKE
jgi:hypothetical protein